jgi:hypothetical protein
MREESARLVKEAIARKMPITQGKTGWTSNAVGAVRLIAFQRSQDKIA